MKSVAALALALAFSCQSVYGQSARPTFNALSRTFMVQTTTERGTIFSIDVDGREYWITAKHLLKGLKHPPYGEFKEKSATVQILNPGLERQQWLTETFSVIDPGNNIDILVLVPSHLILDKPIPLNVGDDVPMGGDCEFLGFPYGGGWRAKFDKQFYWLPYMKHCTVSGMFAEPSKGSPDDAMVWVLDGINNAGFSGGPMLYSTGEQQRVFAVVSGYQTEPTEVLPEVPQIPAPTGFPSKAPASETSEKPEGTKKEVVNVNSGFIVAFGMKSAIDAIRKNPTGPVRPSAATK
jgi:hypothetical protein